MDPLYNELDSLTVPPTLFSEVGFFVSGKVDHRLLQLLECGGARQRVYAGVGVTHFIVGENSDQNKVEEAKDIFDIPIVSPRWILYSAKVQKVLPVNGFGGETNQLFSGLKFTTSRIRGEDLCSVWALVTYHNGEFLRVLTKDCTHLLSNNTLGEKYTAAKKLQLPVVCIDWLTDSIKAGKLLSEKPYDPILITPSSPKYSASDTRLPLTSQNNFPANQNQPIMPQVGEALPNVTTTVVMTPPSWMTTQISPVKRNKIRNRSQDQKSFVNDHLNGTQSFGILQQHQATLPIEQTPNITNRTVFSQQMESGQNHLNQNQVHQNQVNQTTINQVDSDKNLPVPVSMYNSNSVRSIPNDNQRVVVLQGMAGTEDTPTVQQIQTSSQKLPHPVQDSRFFSNIEQLEIIRQIQSDPQIKLQWAQMDHQQRTLLIQKLAQRNREERLRREMMIRQHQMHQVNHLQQPHKTNSLSPKESHNSLVESQQQPMSLNHAHSQMSPSRPPLSNSGTNEVQLSQQQQMMRSRFPEPLRPQFQTQLSNRPTPIIAEDFGKEAEIMESSVQQHQQQPTAFQQQSNQNSMNQGQSTLRRQLPQSVFSPRPGNMTGSPVQRQILVTQHQSGAIIRTDQSPAFTDLQNPQRVPVSQQPQQSPMQKLGTYLQSSVLTTQERPPTHMVLASSQPSDVVRTQQFYTPTSSSTQQPRYNVRQILVQGQTTPQQVLLESPPNSSAPLTQQSPTTQTGIQWSPPSNSVTQGQQRLVSPPAMTTLSPRQIRPDQASQQQQWTIRTQGTHPGGVIYTTQPNMPYAQVVNSKTKTALANLLTNRLMGSTTPEATVPVNTVSFSCGVTGGTTLSRSPSPQSISSAPAQVMSTQVQNRVSTVQSGNPVTQSHLIQRRTLSNLTNSDKGPLNNNIAIVSRTPPHSSSPSYASQTSRFFGHDPSIKLPEDGFLLGCTFWAAQDLKLQWERYVRKYGGEIECAYSSRVTHVLCETQKFPELQQCIRDEKRLVTLFWLNDVISRKSLSSPSQALHLPLHYSENERPYFGELISISGFTGDERVRVQTMCTLLGLTVTRVFTKANIGLIAKSPEGEKFYKAREWRKPVVNIQFLNELLFGHTGVARMIHSPKYQQFHMPQPLSFDVALVAPLMAPWKAPLRVSNEAVERYRMSKRSADSPPSDGFRKHLKLCDEEVEDATALEEYRGNPLSQMEEGTDPSADSLFLSKEEGMRIQSSSVVILLSGFSPPMKDLLTEKIQSLGGRVVEEVRTATHLVIKENALTKKLVLFMCYKDQILSIAWLRASCASGKFVDTNDYLIRTGKVGLYKVNYAEISKIPNRHLLFSGLTFFITPSVDKEIRGIVETYGGSLYFEKSLNKVYEMAMKALQTFCVVTADEDDYLLAGWRTKEGNEKIIIVSQDTIFGWILKQDVLPQANGGQEVMRHVTFVLETENPIGSEASLKLGGLIPILS